MVHLYRVLATEEDDEGHELSDVKMVPFLLTFFRSTSMGGFPQLITQQGILRKIFWMCSIILMALGLYWNCSEFFSSYMTFSASTKVTIQSERRLEFPAVTICNNNPVTIDWFDPTSYNEFFSSEGGSSDPSMGSGDTTIGGAPGTVTAAAATPSTAAPAPTTTTTGAAAPSPSPPPPPPPGKRRKRSSKGKKSMKRDRRFANYDYYEDIERPEREDFGEDMQTILEIQEKAASLAYEERADTSHQLCDMILEARWKGQSVKVGTEFKTWHYNPHFGNCYTFNAGYLLSESNLTVDSNTTFEIKKGADSNGVKVSTRTGDEYGLYLLLNAGKSLLAAPTHFFLFLFFRFGALFAFDFAGWLEGCHP